MKEAHRMEADLEQGMGPESAWRRLLRDRTALIAGTFLGVVVLLAGLATWIAPHDPYLTKPTHMLRPMGSEYWLGTDALGRDMLSRLLHGTRLTLLLGLMGVLLGGAIGGTMGIVSAFYPRLDRVTGRVVDVLLSFPAILFGLALVAVLGAGIVPVILALAFATIPGVARVARSSAIVIMRQEYMEAGRAVGLSDGALIWRYLTRNCLSSIFVFLTIRFGEIILLGAALSFLGLGARPPAAELGMMAAQGRDYLFIAPHVATIPSVTIFMIVLAFNVLSDAVRDILDPRLRQ
jgi:ABC-type dipeptide/oligopeptide/nickel transport system permease subunit